MKHTCAYCNTDYEAPRKSSIFCSVECRVASTTKKIKCNCDNCNKIIYKKPCELKNRKHIFCSKSCHDKFRSEKETITCKNCGKVLETKVCNQRKFCSHDCYMSYSTKTMQVRIELPDRKRNCAICGKSFYTICSTSKQRTCSPDCRKIFVYNKTHDEEYIKNRISKNKEKFYSRFYDMDSPIEIIGDYINSRVKIECRCSLHNEYFKMAPPNILGGQSGCTYCTKSHSEKQIANILKKWGYTFESQKMFEPCRDKRKLPFDFYLDYFNIAIEYDGEHHYKAIPRGHITEEEARENLALTQKHDLIKTNFCKDNSIKLIRVPFWESEDLEYYLWNQLYEFHAIEEIKIIS